MRSGGVLRNNYFIYTLPDQRMIKICRPRQGKQGLCCANLCRRSKGSAVPTCAGEARALLCRPAQEKQGLCCADLCRRSKGSAMPTCAGEAKALLCRPAQGKQRLCCADLRGFPGQTATVRPEKIAAGLGQLPSAGSWGGQSGVMWKVQDAGCMDQMDQAVLAGWSTGACLRMTHSDTRDPYGHPPKSHFVKMSSFSK